MGDSFNRELVLLLGVTPAELEQLDVATKNTKKSLDDLAIHAASRRVSDDGKTLIVTVPSLSAESGALYTNLISTVKQVLGPERYQLFDDLSGEIFDRSFDQFGLNPLTYELTLKPVSTAGGVATYSFKRSYVDAANSGNFGWSSGTTSSAYPDPFLMHFLPTDGGK